MDPQGHSYDEQDQLDRFLMGPIFMTLNIDGQDLGQ